MALLQLLKDKTKLEDNDRHVLSMATTGLERLQTLMADILSYARVGDERRRASVSLEECLDVALSNLRNDILETGADIERGPLPTIIGDRSQMILVFQNLIANSIKFRSANPPTIRIGAAREDRRYVVSITDNGQGFDPKYAEHIFLPFKRLHGQDIPGSGIGLASCRRKLERCGGSIWAESAPGKGATFRFALPDHEPGE